MRTHQFVRTQDGSPSLITGYESGLSEGMHHMGGAATESVYIYGSALESALKAAPGIIRVMSLGLGLGYNELITAAISVRYPSTKFEMVTFEIDKILTGQFEKWLLNQELEAEWTEGFELVLSSVAKLCEQNPDKIKQTLTDWFRKGQWQLLGGFPQCLDAEHCFDVVYYDAFSRKMDEELWQEAFLSQFLANHASPKCVFATYAATGNLKRALRAQKFQLQDRPGFSGKKESTFAIR